MHASLEEKARTIDTLYAQNYTQLDIPMHSTGTKIFISKDEEPVYKRLCNTRNKSFKALYLFKQIASLKNRGKDTSYNSQDAVLSRKLLLEGASVLYEVRNGHIYITSISVEESTSTQKKQTAAGVYKVKLDDGKWELDGSLKNAREIDYINNKNLAVTGCCKGIHNAASYMPAFIKHGFGDAALTNSYALFFNPCYGDASSNFRAICNSVGFLGHSQPAKKLAAVLERVHDKKQAINLTVNETGHALLKAALRELVPTGKQLENVTVFYANPINNLHAVDSLRKKAGMKLATKPPLINPLSITQNFISGNIVSSAVITKRAGNSFGAHSYNNFSFLLTIVCLGSISARVAGVLGVTIFGLGAALVALGQSGNASQKIITTSSEAIAHVACHYGSKVKKLIWDPVYRMMVKA